MSSHDRKRLATRRLIIPAIAAAAFTLLGASASAQTVTVGLTAPGTIGGATGSATVLSFSTDVTNGKSTQADYSEAYAVSADGSVTVGAANTPNGFAHAFRYTAAGGMVDLGALDSANQASVALGVSGDGNTIVGMSTTSAGDWQAFRWTTSGGMVDLGHLGTSAGNYSVAWGVSADGSVVVGASYTDTTIDRAFRWTSASGMVNLGLITGVTSGYSDALGVSGDGNVVVGNSSSTSGFQHGFRWTSSGGMADLGTLNGASGTSDALSADGDGGVVVGRSVFDSSGAFRAFRWTSAGMTNLGLISGATGASTAFGVNGDGAIVVGMSTYGASGTHAFVWTSGSGTQDLNGLLSTAGINMTGVDLIVARGVSADGTTIVGTGTFPTTGAADQAFIARIGGVNGVTTPSSVAASIQALAQSRTAQMLTNQLFNQILLGLNEQVSCGNCGGADVSFGSFNVSSHGRYALGPEWTLLGGASLGQYDERGADVDFDGSVAAALQFDPANVGTARPYLEAGVTGSWQNTRYSRGYANGAGAATGVGSTQSQELTGYVEAGWVDRVTPRDEAALAVNYSRMWQFVGGYREPVGPTNPFNADVSSGVDALNTASLGAQYTHLFGLRVEADANAAVVYAFSGQSGLSATVAGAGQIRGAQANFVYYELGGRIGLRINRALTFDGFINSSLAPRAVGSSVHGGFGLRLDF